MRPYLILASGLLTGLLAPAALAQQEREENADLRERLETQEERLRELESRQDEDQALEQRLEEQQERIDELESSRFDTSGSGGRGPEVDVSGFINAGFQSTNLGKDGPMYRQTDHEVRATNFTSAGVQVDGTITDKVSGSVQFLAEGDESFDTRVEWAYISYDLSPNVKARAGRLVLPFYMNSQSFYVGYAHPWIEPPAEVYDTAPLRSFEGADITWQFNTGSMAHSLNYYFGNTSVDSSFRNINTGASVPYRVHNLHGLNLSSTLGNLNTWLAYSSGDVNLDLSNAATGLQPPQPTTFGPTYSQENADAYFASAGLEYDNGNFMFLAEAVELDIKSDWFPKSRAQYVTAGYHFGAWTPHLTWANSEDRTFDKIDGDPLGEGLYNSVKTHQKSWTLGLRHDTAPGLALKAEVSTYYDVGASDDNGANDAGLFSGPIPDDEDDPMVFRLSANLVF